MQNMRKLFRTIYKKCSDKCKNKNVKNKIHNIKINECMINMRKAKRLKRLKKKNLFYKF